MTKFNSALFVAVAIAAMGALTHPAAAIEYPWCAQYSGQDGGGRNCGFVSFEAVHGNDPRHGRLLRAELILHGPYRAARQPRAKASAQRGKTRPNIFTDESQTDTSRSPLNQKDRLAAVSPKSDRVF